jgi:hypothetical protein
MGTGILSDKYSDNSLLGAARANRELGRDRKREPGLDGENIASKQRNAIGPSDINRFAAATDLRLSTTRRKGEGAGVTYGMMRRCFGRRPQRLPTTLPTVDSISNAI